MAGQAGGGPPYGAVAFLILGVAEDPLLGPWIRGRLALAGIGLHTDLRVWLDAVYALWLEAPEGDRVRSVARQLEQKAAMIRPEEARETWGRSAVAQALSGGLGRGAGAESGGGGPPVGAALAAYERIQQRNRMRGR